VRGEAVDGSAWHREATQTKDSFVNLCRYGIAAFGIAPRGMVLPSKARIR